MMNEQEAEKLIREILQLPSNVDGEQNLLQLGIHSIEIMKFIGKLYREKNIKITIAELMNVPTFKAWIKILMSKENNTISKLYQYKRKINKKNTIFNTTNVQYSYIVGSQKKSDLGAVDCHAYIEFAGKEIDVNRLEKAWKKLFEFHPMLRACFCLDGTQMILDKPYAYNFYIYDLASIKSEEVLQEKLTLHREELSHKKMKIFEGEVARLGVTLLPNRKYCIHFDINLLICDAMSIHILLNDFANLYAYDKNSEVDCRWSFQEYLLDQQEILKCDKEIDKQYWMNRIHDLPFKPQLPVKHSAAQLYAQHYSRRQFRLSNKQWQMIQQNANNYKVTVSMVLLTVYALVIERWSENDRFLLNLPIFNRNGKMEDIDKVISDFTDVLLLDTDLQKEEIFVDTVYKLQRQFYEDLSHKAYSGVDVLRKLSSLYPEVHDFAPVVFSCMLGSSLITKEIDAILGTFQYMVTQTPQVWIDCQVFEVEDELMISWDTPDDLFEKSLLDEMFEAFQTMIQNLADRTDIWTQMCDCLTSRQQKQHIERTKITVPRERKTLLDGFLENAKKNPQKTALVDAASENTYTYEELLIAAQKIHMLLSKNLIEAGEKVAFTLPRGIKQIEAAVGILAAGGCYVPVSVEQPLERRKIIHEKMKIKYVLTNRETAEKVVFPVDVHKIYIDDAKTCDQKEIYKINPESLAYIILTSGSTGEPKGVKIKHSAAWNTIEDVNRRCQITQQDIAIAVSAMDFDLSVYDVFGILGAGGTLIILSDERKRDADFWLRVIQKYNITVWNSVPILLKMLLTYAESRNEIIDSLRVIMLSGDWIGLELPNMIQSYCKEARLIAMGGATEASIWSNFYEVEGSIDKTWNSIPYGSPLSYQEYLVMDNKQRPCPVWTPGELWIGGMGVAAGYCEDDILTKQKFVVYQESVWYRTGDQGRYWEDGTIEFLGRKDFQVKIKGHRIEIGEIETALRKQEEIEEVVIIPIEEQKRMKFLAAYITLKANIDFAEDDMRKNLLKYIPEYMIPAKFIVMDSLPITANGKIDRKNLPAVNKVEAIEDTNLTDTENALANIWKEILKIDTIRATDNYFYLGGNSLTAIQIALKIREVFGLEISITEIFAYTQLRNLADYIKAKKEKSAVNTYPDLIITKNCDNTPFMLTDIQYAYWVGKNKNIALGGVSTCFYLEFACQSIDYKRLNRAWNQVIKSQEMMRAVILPDGKQMISDNLEEYKIQTYDLTGIEEKQLTEQRSIIRQNLMLKETKQEFFIVVLSQLDCQKSILHFRFDNIIFDGWSIFYVLEKLKEYYEDENKKEISLSISYRDYVNSMQQIKYSDKYQEDKQYWLGKIDTIAPYPKLPLNKIPEKIKNQTYLHLKRGISKKVWNNIQNFSRKYHVTTACVSIAVYAEVLSRWCEDSKFTLNITQFNRQFNHSQINEIVGDFTTPVLLSVDMRNGNSFLERVCNIQNQLMHDLEHPYFNGVAVQRELAKRKDLGYCIMPVVFTSTVGLDAFSEKQMLGEICYAATQTPQVWLDFQMMETQKEIVIRIDAVKELFPEGVSEDILSAIEDGFMILAKKEEIWETNNIVTIKRPFEKKEVAKLIEQKCLDELFVQNVIQYREKAAVITENRTLSYGELFQYAYQLSKCIKKGSIVAISMEKGVEQVIAVMGILMAGAVYMPIDPENPMDRKKTIYENSQASLLLTQSWIIEKSKHITDEIYCVDAMDISEIIEIEDFKSISDFESAAYIIFTSGSTGIPKGVVISHHGAVNTILDINTRWNISGRDSILALSNLNFDLSVYDILGMLAVGGTIVIPTHKERKNPKHWITLIQKYKISIWNSVPAFMQMLIMYIEQNIYDIKGILQIVMLSGDWIPLKLPELIKNNLGSDIRIMSLGGATEASIWSNYYEIEKVQKEWKSIPYGYPLTNQSFKIKDDLLRDRPVMVVGNLYIGGDGLALGYLNDKAETNRKFIIDAETGERLYDTGDLGRYWIDGTIEFLGRRDFQVKINGHRIELGEIESGLKKVSNVQDAIVTISSDIPEKKYIIAHILIEKDKQVDRKSLKCELEKKVPEYMMPDFYHIMSEVPVTINGKCDRKELDRQALLIMQEHLKEKRIVRKIAVTNTEKNLAKVWCDVLEREVYDIEESFFDAGGDSLLMIKLMNELKTRFDYTVSMDCIFEAQSIALIAKRIQDGTA